MPTTCRVCSKISPARPASGASGRPPGCACPPAGRLASTRCRLLRQRRHRHIHLLFSPLSPHLDHGLVTGRRGRNPGRQIADFDLPRSRGFHTRLRVGQSGQGTFRRRAQAGPGCRRHSVYGWWKGAGRGSAGDGHRASPGESGSGYPRGRGCLPCSERQRLRQPAQGTDATVSWFRHATPAQLPRLAKTYRTRT